MCVLYRCVGVLVCAAMVKHDVTHGQTLQDMVKHTQSPTS